MFSQDPTLKVFLKCQTILQENWILLMIIYAFLCTRLMVTSS